MKRIKVQIKCDGCGELNKFDLIDIDFDGYLYCGNEECEHVLDIEDAVEIAQPPKKGVMTCLHK